MTNGSEMALASKKSCNLCVETKRQMVKVIVTVISYVYLLLADVRIRVTLIYYVRLSILFLDIRNICLHLFQVQLMLHDSGSWNVFHLNLVSFLICNLAITHRSFSRHHILCLVYVIKSRCLCHCVCFLFLYMRF